MATRTGACGWWRSGRRPCPPSRSAILVRRVVERSHPDVATFVALALAFGTVLLPFSAWLFGHTLGALTVMGAWALLRPPATSTRAVLVGRAAARRGHRRGVQPRHRRAGVPRCGGAHPAARPRRRPVGGHGDRDDPGDGLRLAGVREPVRGVVPRPSPELPGRRCPRRVQPHRAEARSRSGAP